MIVYETWDFHINSILFVFIGMMRSIDKDLFDIVAINVNNNFIRNFLYFNRLRLKNFNWYNVNLPFIIINFIPILRKIFMYDITNKKIRRNDISFYRKQKYTSTIFNYVILTLLFKFIILLIKSIYNKHLLTVSCNNRIM